MAEKNWNQAYNKDDNSELRELQLAELENMRMFSEICDKHNLRYFLIGGTMLGAIRHKGFIPWDDDMDVGMPRPDYERFIEIAPQELPEGFAFLNYKKNEDYKRYFSRVVNLSVIVTNKSNTKTIEENAWLDIFPFDGMPEGSFGRKLHFWNVTISRFLYHASCFDELVNLNRPGRAWYLQCAIKFLLLTHFGSHINTKKQLDKVDRKLKKYGYDDYRYVVNMFGAYMEREVISKELLGSLPRYQFEDLMLPGAEHYDPYLSNFYGDYMKPPKDADKDKHNIGGISHEVK